MIIYFTTRQAMRQFVSKGKAKGLFRKPIDMHNMGMNNAYQRNNGTRSSKRWAVMVSNNVLKGCQKVVAKQH